MKKITLLILMLFLSFAGFSQFTEGFEGTTVPNIAAKQWVLGSGTWGVFDNGVGTTKSWGVNSGVTTPPLVHSGLRAAYMVNDNIGIGNMSQDFLATPMITVPANGELKFWARTLQNGNQGTIYKIMVSNTAGSQTNPAAYTLIQQWNEDQLVTDYNIYEEKSVNLTAFAGQNIHIAFVMEYTQNAPGLGGDRWLLDDVRIVEKCLDPTTLGANTITQTSANLTWANPGNATNFEIQVLPATGTLGSTGMPVTGTTYPATATTNPIAPLTPSTLYKFYVRAICAGNVASVWVGPFSFSTSSPGLTCTSPIVIPSTLPYTTTDNTVAYGDTTDDPQAANCTTVAGNYMTGNDVFYSFTPTTTGAIQIEMSPGATYSGIFVYEGCANVGINCVAGVANPQNTPRIIPSLQVTAGTTYIIVLSSNATPQTFPYTLTIQALNCASPTSLFAVGATPTSAHLTWGNPGAATSWEVFVQTAGSAIPAGAGLTANTNTNFEVSTLTGTTTPLQLGTSYQYWVRANCGDGTFSIWSGPYAFNLAIPAVLPFTDGFEGPNTWTLLNGTQNNKWFYGSAVSNTGTNSMYVSNDNGLTNTYTNNTTSVTHFYRDLLIPANTNDLNVQFDWRAAGESNYDYIRVWAVPTNFTPVPGTQITAGPGRFQLGANINQNPAFTTSNYVVNATSFAGQAMRLVFEWRNDGSGGTQPPGAIDNVTVNAIICSAPTALVAPVIGQTNATISWTGIAGTTSYDYFVSTTNTTPAATATPTATVTGTTAQLDGLLPSSQYFVWVRSNCGPNGTSTWTGPVYITTAQIAGTLPYVDGFEGVNTWSINNGTQTNKWFSGTAVSNSGTHSMYVSNDNGLTNTYSLNPTSVTHFYRDLIVPAGTTDLNVQFDWRAQGEGSSDYIRVWAVPISYVPTAGTQVTAAAGRVQLGGNINQNSTWSTATYVLNATTTFAGQTMRLIFEWRNDGSGGAQPPGAIDNVVVNAITCYAPSALVATNVGESTATISWTAPASGAASYDYYVSTTNTAPTATQTPTGNVVPTTTPLTGLTSSTNYFVWVRSNCGPGGTSTWAGPVLITTSQVAGVLPFNDGFEGVNQWSIYNGNQANKWFLGTAVSNTGTKSMYVSSDNGVTNSYLTGSNSVTHFYRDLIVPVGTGELNVQFDWRAQGESSWDYIRVWAVPTTYVPVPGTQVIAGAGRIQLGGNINQNSSWSTANYVLNGAGFAGGTMRLIFEWRNDSSGGTQPPGAIDNVVVNVITCSSPSALVLNSVGQTTADISWTAPPGGAPGSYDYYVSNTVTAPTAAAIPTGNVQPANLQLQDLTPSTTYFVWVRSNCGADGTSTWIGPIAVTTGQIPAVMPFIEGFEGTTAWSFNSGTQTNKWIIGTAASNGGANSLYITNDNGISNAYNTSGATTVAHAYRDIQMPAVIGDVNVEFDWRAVGEGTWDFLRVWVVPTTFVPTVGTQITATANRKQLGQYNNSGQWLHVQQFVDAAPYAGQSMRLVFEWRNDGSGGAQPPAAIDNVKVNVLTCPAPINLTAAGVSGSTAITLGWTPVGTETSWEVIVQVAGTGAPVAGTGTIVNGTPTLPFTATEGVFYEFFVIANCNATESSLWAGPQSFSIYTPPGCAEVQLSGVGFDIIDSEIILCAENDSQCVNLEANYFGIGSTTSYEVSAISYEPPFPFTGGIEMPITSDDDYTPSFTLPFNFCFFGESYDFVKVGDNGVISFGQPFTTDYGDFCPWTLNGPIPSTTFSIKNAIYGVFQDMYTTNNPGANTSINYQVLGTYPCRALVVNFNEVPAFGSGCVDPEYRTTTQIVLYEISNVIEIYVKKRTACNDWQQGKGVIGIQNGAGTIAYVPSGRNTGNWNATNEAWRFEPNGDSNVEFEWLKDGVFYSNDLNIEVCVTDTTLMTAKATYQGCDGVDIVTTSQVTIVTTTEIPTADPIDLTSCSATGPLVFDLTQNTATILAGAVNPGEFTITYYLSQEDADLQQNPILNPATFEGVNGQTIYVGVNSAANCFIVKSFQLIEGSNTVAIVDFTYTSPICYNASTPNPLPIKALNFSAGGTFNAAGLTINAATGEIDLSTNPQGTFDVTYVLLPSDCNDGGSFTFPITLNTAPVLDAVSNQVICEGDSYELPVLTAGNYFTATQGVGPLSAGDLITTTQTIYVFAGAGTCSSEVSFEVTVTPLPVIAPIEDVVSCGPYTLPAIAVGNYYTATAQGGILLPAGSIISTDQTIYVSATTGTTPSCTSEISFTVEIVNAITLAPIADVIACDSYELPALAVGNYYTATQGGGTMLVAGDLITSTQTIFVYATGATADCNAEISFMVTINATPVIAPIADVVSCGPYTLPVLAVGNYFDQANGLGNQIPAGTAITTDQTVYVFATTGTTPDCTASASFTVTIVDAVVLAPIDNVSICSPDVYTLPALAQGNYYTQTNGGGSMLAAGATIAQTQTIYVFEPGATPACNSEVSFTVTVTTSPMFVVQGNCVGNQYILTSTAVDSDLTGAVYSWTVKSGAGTIVGSASDATVTVEGAATYTLTVTVGGCSTAQDFVADNTSCMIQRGISPNGDGLNDYFDLEGQGVSELEIFNRYGTKVYNQNNYSNQWVGQSNKGDELPDGVYYYVIKRTSGENRTGWIYINR
ncbi:fibronectin type III domain-containing protein [Flavobacterium ardleyense]|uniref:fibronectin type III domain-containing protein n=1 Tax=Flavobacterium ardleyense TaxID=2038737 RepID=UPI00298D1B40|nr:fibronectin type III domain-containing protein [Flavobacterium ardleyense]